MHMTERHLRHQSLALLEDIAHWQVCEQAKLLAQALAEHKYRPDQPRVPAGNSDGGQWTGGGGGSGFVADKPKPNPRVSTPPITPPAGGDDLLSGLLGELTRRIPGLGDLRAPKPILNVAPGDEGAPDPYPDRIDPVYPVETLIALLTPFGRILNGVRSLLGELGGALEENTDTEWTLGDHKSPTTWRNQQINRGWTDEKITNTIRYGEQYRAPNDVNPTNGATRYEYNGNYVVRDNQTKQILQIGKPDFIRQPIPPQ